MKTKITLLSFLFFIFSGLTLSTSNESDLYYGKKKIQVSASQSDAEIYVNGKMIGKGSARVIVPKDDCVTVTAKKIG